MSVVSYLQGVQQEVKLVKWPTRRQTILYTSIVIVLSVITAAYLGALDFGFSMLTEKLIEFASR